MSKPPDLALVSIDEMVGQIQTGVDGLLTWYFAKKGNKSRRGAQVLAVAVICKVAWEHGLTPDAEFEMRYFDGDGEETIGWLDAVIYGSNRHKGLLLAAEIVMDRVPLRDLLKLRDAPVATGGKRLLVQLNPYVKYPIVRPIALSSLITDQQAEGITLLYYRRGSRTLLERRTGGLWAAEEETRNLELAETGIKM